MVHASVTSLLFFTFSFFFDQLISFSKLIDGIFTIKNFSPLFISLWIFRYESTCDYTHFWSCNICTILFNFDPLRIGTNIGSSFELGIIHTKFLLCQSDLLPIKRNWLSLSYIYYIPVLFKSSKLCDIFWTTTAMFWRILIPASFKTFFKKEITKLSRNFSSD